MVISRFQVQGRDGTEKNSEYCHLIFFFLFVFTFQELIRSLDPLVDIVQVLHFHVDDVRAGVSARSKVKQRTRLGERQRGKQVDEEQDQQKHQETAHVLVNFLLYTINIIIMDW